MKIEKRTDSSYRVRQTYKGKTYTVHFDHKPTQKEVLQAMADKMDAPVIENKGGTLESYIDKYIAEKEKQTKPVISPSTIRGYESIKKNLSEEFLKQNLYDLTSNDVQRELKEYKKTRSAKTTKNAYSLIRSVFASYRADYNLVVKLSSDEPKAEYEPTTDDIKRILEYAKGSEFSIALQLATLGLRRGEVVALTIEDLSEDNVLTINKDMVVDKNNRLITKSTKTEASNRRIAIPSALADEIRTQGYIFKGYPNSISRYLHKVQDKLGIPRFRLHMLRHFCVAYLHKQGFTEEQIMSYGGWQTSDIMKRAYRYNLDPAESQKQISDRLSDLF